MRSASVHRCIRCSTYRIEAHAESPFEFAVAANLSDRGWRNVWTLAETVWEYGTITCFWFKKLVKRAGTVQSSLFLPKFPFLFFFFCKLPKVACFQKFAFAKRSAAMKAPVGLLSDRTVLRSKMEGPCPDKFTLTRLDFCGNLLQQFNITYFYIFVQTLRGWTFWLSAVT